jgi:hypothetical protein
MYTTDTATGAWVFGDTKMTGYGLHYDVTVGAPSATPPARTLTFTVTRPNGQLQYLRTTTLAEVMQEALAAQPAA